jgi:tRNA threonylcarbamoyladenosine biosynthesis protein TsaB
VIVLGFDTATSATAVALQINAHAVGEARDDPPTGAHPGHATRLLSMADELLQAAGVSWSELDRVAAGVGPGAFTGLRVGVATARGIAQAQAVELVGVSSLAALAHAALPEATPHPVMAVIDARRREVFAAVYRANGSLPLQLTEPQAIAPASLAEVLGELEGADGAQAGVLAVGDGAERYRDDLQRADIELAPPGSPLHRVSAASVCALGAQMAPLDSVETLLPDYRRRPDAEISTVGSGA